jgi:hypothetical protein
MQDIYDRFFLPWCEKHYPDEDVASFSTLRRARRDPQFDNVKEKIKHYHLKCDQCAYFSKAMSRGFTSRAEETEVNRLYVEHNLLHREWRRKEEKLMQEASHNPDRLTLIRCDDTEAVKFPHPGSRQWKGLSRSQGFEVIPWCVEDVSRGVREYVYTPKRLVPHGANRFCTLLHTVLQANRSCGTAAAEARRLVIIVDNYGENRNYANFAFLSEIVLSGWYDSAELLFGPVGHTHNGVDAIHHKHNVSVGAYFAGTLAHYIHNYGLVFTSPSTRPSASLCLIQYDWDEHYRNNTIRLNGINARCRVTGALLAVGFKVARRGNDPLVQVWYTQDTTMTPRWIGIGNEVDGPGFVALKRRPSAPPRLINPRRTVRNDAVLKWIKKVKLAEQVRVNGENAEGCIEWVTRAAKTGTVPVNEYLDDEHRVPNGRFGTPAKIGVVGGLEVTMDVIVGHADGTSTADFWKTTDLQTLPRTLAVGMRPVQPVLGYALRRDRRQFLAISDSSGANGAVQLLGAGEHDPPIMRGEEASDEVEENAIEGSVCSYRTLRGRRGVGDQGDGEHHWVSDSSARSGFTRTTQRKRRKVARRRTTGKVTASTCRGLIKVGTKCYAVDKESDDGKWIVTKGKVQARTGKGKKIVYRVWFNGHAEPYMYPRSDVFSSREEAEAVCEGRDAEDLTSGSGSGDDN